MPGRAQEKERFKRRAASGCQNIEQLFSKVSKTQGN